MKNALVLCAVAALGLSATASADPSTLSLSYETVRVDIPYGDLDLNKPAGAKTMMFRIRNASAEACGGEPYIRELRERRVFKICLRQTMAAAIDDLRSPQVAALFQEELERGRV
jgi:UrcA family protein